MSEKYGSPEWHRRVRGIPSKQLNFDSMGEYYEVRSKSRSWKYDDDFLKNGILSGVSIVQQKDLLDTFINWHLTESVVTFKSNEGQSFSIQAPRRGNYTFAKEKKKILDWIGKGLDKLDLWVPIGNRTVMFKTHLLLFTLTYTQHHHPIREKLSWEFECQQAWQYSTSEIAKFRSKLARALNTSISSITVKEGTENGFPAPHVLYMSDKPITVFRHINKHGDVTFRIQDNSLLRKIKSFWKHGFVDTQGIVSKSHDSVGYVLKYMTKGLSQAVIEKYQKSGINGLTKHDITFLKTHSYQKLFNLRPVQISAQFKAHLNPSGRLDNNGAQSQHAVWYYYNTKHMDYRDYWELRRSATIEVVPPPQKRLDVGSSSA